MKNLNGLLSEKADSSHGSDKANEPPQGQSWIHESGSYQSAKQFGRARHQSRLSAMPVDTVWHCIGHSSGVRRLLPTYIQRPKNEKGKQLEALIEARGIFRSVSRRLCVKELRLGHIFNGLRRHRGPETSVVDTPLPGRALCVPWPYTSATRVSMREPPRP